MTRPARPSRTRGGTGGPGKKHAPAQNAPADAATLNLTTIYRDHGQFIWLSLQRFGVRLPDLDDLAQDVFMVVHRKLSHLDPRGPIRPWLFGICMRVAANYRRRRRRASKDLSLWGHTPVYVRTVANPKTCHAVLSRLCAPAIAATAPGRLARGGREFLDRELNRLLDQNEGLRSYIRKLEEQLGGVVEPRPGR